MIKFIFALNLLVAASSAEECKIACERIYEPICGSDGVTYSNLCELEATNCLTKSFVQPMFEGHCSNSEDVTDKECDLACQLTYDPVCGSDGSTYDNMCALKATSCLNKNSVSLKHEGECQSKTEQENVAEECSFKCHHNYEPVCGSDGITYRNPCALDTLNCLHETEVVIASEGECVDEPYQAGHADEPYQAGHVDEPYQAGHADEPYQAGHVDEPYQAGHVDEPYQAGHADEPYQAGRFLVPEHDDCNMPCQMMFAPLCASNGQTFSSLCELKSYNCLTKSSLQVIHEGEC